MQHLPHAKTLIIAEHLKAFIGDVWRGPTPAAVSDLLDSLAAHAADSEKFLTRKIGHEREMPLQRRLCLQMRDLELAQSFARSGDHAHKLADERQVVADLRSGYMRQCAAFALDTETSLSADAGRIFSDTARRHASLLNVRHRSAESSPELVLTDVLGFIQGSHLTEVCGPQELAGFTGQLCFDAAGAKPLTLAQVAKACLCLLVKTEIRITVDKISDELRLRELALTTNPAVELGPVKHPFLKTLGNSGQGRFTAHKAA